MAIGVVATIKIQAGKNAEFEAVAKEMMAAVRANEPGNKLYSFCKSRRTRYDLCRDGTLCRPGRARSAWQVGSLQDFGAKIGPCLLAVPDVQFFDAV